MQHSSIILLLVSALLVWTILQEPSRDTVVAAPTLPLPDTSTCKNVKEKKDLMPPLPQMTPPVRTLPKDVFPDEELTGFSGFGSSSSLGFPIH